MADRGDLYFSVRAIPTTEGLVLKVPRCGGPVTTIASAQDDAITLAVQGDSLYWGTMGDDNSGAFHGTVMRAPLGGGAPTTLVSNTGYGGATIDSIAVDTAWVYATGWNSVLQSLGAWKVPVGGGPAVGVGPVDQIFTEVALDATEIFLAQNVMTLSMSDVLSVPIGGGAPTVLVPSGVISGIVLDDTSLYYVSAPSTLTRIAKHGGTPAPLASVALRALAVDATDVYWLEGDATTHVPDAIKRIPKGGGTTTTLSTSHADAFAVDDAYVYWLHGGDLMRLSK